MFQICHTLPSTVTLPWVTVAVDCLYFLHHMGPTLPTNPPTTRPSKPQPTSCLCSVVFGRIGHPLTKGQSPKSRIAEAHWRHLRQRQGGQKLQLLTWKNPARQTAESCWRMIFRKKQPPGKPPAALVFWFEERCFKRLWWNSTLMKPTPFNQTKKKKTHQSYHRVHRPQTCWDGIALPLAHDYTRRRRSDPRQCLALNPGGRLPDAGIVTKTNCQHPQLG